ncbi:MAG: DUF3108 domain-containing protein [Gammaproteobacteria bacterium]|nr:DUF3108 domain-containing protein [Gammaproteobacteria bacterium]
MNKLSLLLALTIFSGAALAFKSHNTEYEVFWGDRSVGTLAVEATAGEDTATVVSKLNAHGIAAAVMPGTRTQTSQFIKADGDWQQQSLLATRTKRVKVGLRGSREEEAVMNTIEFDHANGKAVATEKKDTVTLEVDAKTADRQSLMLLVTERWKAASEEERKAGIPYTFINGIKLRTYTFREVRTETLETDVGTFNAVKLVHGSEDDKHTVVWLAEELDYFPVGFDKARPRSKGVSVTTRISQLPEFK